MGSPARTPHFDAECWRAVPEVVCRALWRWVRTHTYPGR